MHMSKNANFNSNYSRIDNFSGLRDPGSYNEGYGYHCVKSVRIRSNSGPCFPVFGLNIDQNKSEYEHFLHCVQRPKLSLHEIT